MKFSFALLTLFSVSMNAWADVRPILKETIEALKFDNCTEKMSHVDAVLASLKPSDYQTELKGSGPEGLGVELWDFKIKVHTLLREFYQKGSLTRDCANAYRGALRAIRYVEDLAQEHQYRIIGGEFPSNAFVAGNLHVKRAPKFKDFDMIKDLKSGDVILTRGNAYTSAAIASLGEFDTQFSHMSLVYIDADKKVWTVEAHIEVGSFVRPIEDHIKDNNFRTMIFRFDDEKLAAKAAELMFIKVRDASKKTGNILYDFGFDMKENNSLFCSEIVSYGFSLASDSKLQIPLYTSRLMLRKPSFVKNLGITEDESFIPADIEVDPRFQIIAEWRDAARVQDNHEKDAILHAMFEWADEFDYRMIQGSSKTSRLYRNVVWPLRRVPILKRYFKDKLPINMSRTLIGYFGVLESTAEMLQKELKVANGKAISTRSLPLLREESHKVLDDFRINDAAQRKPKMHQMYRPLDPKEMKD
jgi:hypothetical protein